MHISQVSPASLQLYFPIPRFFTEPLVAFYILILNSTYNHGEGRACLYIIINPDLLKNAMQNCPFLLHSVVFFPDYE